MVISLAVALVSLAAAVAALVLGGGDGEGDRRSALEAARLRTAAITTYDHRTLDADVAAVLQTATGEFARDYRATSAALRPTFVTAKAVSVAEVVGVGLESGDAHRAVAVVAVNQVITTAGAAPRTERNRLRMTLVRPGGTWLVARVQRL